MRRVKPTQRCQVTRDLDLLSTEKVWTGADAGHFPKPFIAVPSFPPLSTTTGICLSTCRDSR
jgi:hypothetical protein